MPSERSTVLLQTLAPYYTTVTTAAVTPYWALMTAAPAASGGTFAGAEVATAGYARQQIALTTPTWNAAANAWEVSNAAAITFGPVTADMVPVPTYVALLKGAGATTAAYWWPITSAPLNGDSLYFAPQSLIIRSGDA